MNWTESAEPRIGTEALSEVDFTSFASAATRRYVVPPLIISLLLSGAMIESFLALPMPLDSTLGETLRPIIERYLDNGFSQAILILFLAACIYCLLQMIGIAVDRSRLRSMGRAESPRSRASRLALLAGRPAEAVWVGPVPGDLHDLADRYCLQRRHSAELGMLPLRFAIWALPLLGFIGTVVGVARSIGGLEVVIAAGPGGQPTEGLMTVLDGLQFAFDTTLLGLLAVIPVMMLQMFLGGRESIVTEEGRCRVLTLLNEAVSSVPRG